MPLLQPILLLVYVMTLLDYWGWLWPYMYPTPTVHRPSAIVEIYDFSTNIPPILIPVNSNANTRLFPASIHPIEGFIAAITIIGDGLVVPRQILHTNRIFLTSV